MKIFIAVELFTHRLWTHNKGLTQQNLNVFFQTTAIYNKNFWVALSERFRPVFLYITNHDGFQLLDLMIKELKSHMTC